MGRDLMSFEEYSFGEAPKKKVEVPSIGPNIHDKIMEMQRGKEYELYELCKKVLFEKYGEIIENADFYFSINESDERTRGLEFAFDKIESLSEERIISSSSKYRMMENMEHLKENTVAEFLNSKVLANGIKKIFGITEGAEYLSLLNKLNENEDLVGSFRLEWETGDLQSVMESKKILKSIERGEGISESAKHLFESSMPIIFVFGNNILSMLNESVNGIYGLITSFASPDDIFEEEEMDPDFYLDEIEQILEKKKAKPDFLDLDKDGNKKESMKKAAKDAKGEDEEPEEKGGSGLSAAQMKLPEGLRKAILAKKKAKKSKK
jgi:hypothetical protein